MQSGDVCGDRRLVAQPVPRWLPAGKPASAPSLTTWSARGKRIVRPTELEIQYRAPDQYGRGTEQLSHSFALIDLLPYGRQEEWQDCPDGWPQSPTYSKWARSQDIAKTYGSQK